MAAGGSMPLGGSGAPAPTGDVIESRIDGEFEGWTGETVYALLNGQYWQQAVYSYRYHFAYSPAVRILEENRRYLMYVDGIDDSVEVRLIDAVADSPIVSDFDGWDGETLFELQNGQIWQQSGPGVAVHVFVRPRAILYRDGSVHRMHVQGVQTTVQVARIQ
jgi:hypothetical protein